MNYETAIRRNYSGDLNAETIIPMGFDRRELRVSTRKSSRGGLHSSAQCVQVDPDGNAYRFIVFGDFNASLGSMPGRCTEKNIRAQHAAALAGIEPVLDKCRAFYPQPVAA